MQKAGPSTLSPRKKNPCGKFVRSSQKMILINLYKSIISENAKIKYKTMIEELSSKTGIGKSTVVKTIAEYKATGTVSSPNKKKIRANILEKTSNDDILAIRRKIDELRLQKENLNLQKILEAVNNDDTLPSFSRSSLFRLLKKMDIEYKNCK